jgi:tRNA-Thr(GGU) m(6)t(6)A37 methyltransferase TsaA
MNITLKPIGFARNNEKKHFGGWADVDTELIINAEYRDALLGLGDYSHLIVIYWMHEVKTCDIRHIPQGKAGEVPEVGIFACRCAQRPNPIGTSTVKLMDIANGVVTVRGLDVVNGTPILDIKPYTPQYDAPQGDVAVPDWVNKLDY